jgi:hypothetical protein
MEPARKRMRYDEGLMKTNTWKLLITAAAIIDKMSVADAIHNLTTFYHVLVAIAYNKRQAEGRYAKLAEYRRNMREFHRNIVDERLAGIPPTHWYFSVLENFKNANYTAIDNCIVNTISMRTGPININAYMNAM